MTGVALPAGTQLLQGLKPCLRASRRLWRITVFLGGGGDFAFGLMENLGFRVAYIGRGSRRLELFRGIREAYQAGGKSLASGIGLCAEGHGLLQVFRGVARFRMIDLAGRAAAQGGIGIASPGKDQAERKENWGKLLFMASHQWNASIFLRDNGVLVPDLIAPPVAGKLQGDIFPSDAFILGKNAGLISLDFINNGDLFA